ncbi:MAG: HAMP domain-containing sensor histidine kinase [Eubacteriales bacterium]|nr:HAMP domain-containing sensor histidine kinase [Eubacteriales bacterium]
MEKNSVKRNIFFSNAVMVLATLILFLMINAFVVKVYSELIEHELQTSMEAVVDNDALEDIMDYFAVRKNDFIILFVADGILCIAVLVMISQIFTRRLTARMMEPLDALSEGAKRIREGDLTQAIRYSGYVEFEQTCGAFNEMQRHILEEQEKNRRYEQARTDMIAGISHDLRTPLTAVRGTIKGLLDGIASTPEQQQKFLDVAYRRTGDMDMLLRQLFYLSRLETGSMPLSLRPVEISEFIEDYVSAKRGLLPDGAHISSDAGAVHAEILADPEQLQRVFDNLADNSRKYADADPLRMKISLTRLPGGVNVRFSDNGKGVSAEKLPFLFDEFYRADESRNQKEGNGLGLYIVKYLIEAMGGSVRAESEDGFSVCIGLPLKCSKEDSNGQ